jgi:phospholipase C
MTERRGELGDPERNERLEAENPESFMRRREFLTRTAALAGAAGLASTLPTGALLSQAAKVQNRAALPSPSNTGIDTVVVLMMENRSFDHYFGWHEFADGQNDFTYLDDDGNPHDTHSLAPDFQGCAFHDPDHSWEGWKTQYADGAMDGFRKGRNDDFAIGYYNKVDLPFIPAVADEFTLYDRYFCSARTETWPNRLYMHSGTAMGERENASPQDAANANPGGGLYRWETIWDRMIAANLSVTYYASDLPFIGVFGKRYNDIVKPVSEFYSDAAAGTLPNLAFVDPQFLDGGGGHGLSGDEHPHGDIRIGQAFMSNVTHAFLLSPQYQSGVLFINYDEWGGFFDHVPPRLVPDDLQNSNPDENWGVTGFRIPGVAVSPFTRGGGALNPRVSHMTITHDSILKFISYLYGLGYLNKRHRYASNIARSFDFGLDPEADPPDLPIVPPPVTTPCVNEASAEPAEETGQPAESQELTIGSPEIVDYLERAGYSIGSGDPTEIFANPDSTVQRLRQQIEAAGQLRQGSGVKP